jgi:hypothetical protein
MANAVLIQNSVQAMNIDSLNRSAISAADNIDNGNVFYLATKSVTAGEGEVWIATKPASASGLKLSFKLLNPTYISIADGSIGTQRVTAYELECVDNSTGLWMAYSPEIVTVTSGTKKYRGINPDPRDFTNLAGEVFTAFKPQVGDIITITADGIGDTAIGSNTYAVAKDSQYKLDWANSVNS